MKTALITGSAGLIGSEATEFFIERGFRVIGIDNDLRAYFFGKEASTKERRKELKIKFKGRYKHFNIDIRDRTKLEKIFKNYPFELIIHTALHSRPMIGQPASQSRILELMLTPPLVFLRISESILPKRYLFLPLLIKFTETGRMSFL